MNESMQLLFMQTRIVRLASKRWNKSMDRVVDLFKRVDVLGYIEAGFGIFHCEGDEAVLDDVEKYMAGKGVAYRE